MRYIIIYPTKYYIISYCTNCVEYMIVYCFDGLPQNVFCSFLNEAYNTIARQVIFNSGESNLYKAKKNTYGT